MIALQFGFVNLFDKSLRRDKIDIAFMKKPYSLWVCLILAIVILFIPFLTARANNDGQFELGDPGIMPNSFWYNFEIMKERVVIIFTFSNLSKAKKILNLSTERISELKKMAELGDIPNSQKVINRYNNFLDEMKSNLNDCNQKDGKTLSQIEKSRQTAAWQEEQLIAIKKTAPKELEADINSAIQKATDIINMKCE